MFAPLLSCRLIHYQILRNKLSRRLREADDHIKKEIKELRKAAQELKPADCEGDTGLCDVVQTQLRLIAELLTLRFHYLSVVPWSFCKADTPAGAAEFLRGATSRPLAEQDPLTSYLLNKHEEALQALENSVSVGGGRVVVPDPALVEEVEEINNTPLDESAGEGYHRGTNHTRTRCTGAKTPYIKQSTRTKANLILMKQFARMGPQGQRVVRFEWRNWKRILQVQPRYYWRNVRDMNAEAVFRRVYRMDEMAQFSWSSDLVRAPGQGPAPVAHVDTKTRQSLELRCEYAMCVLEPKRWYSVSVPRAAFPGDGEVVEEREVSYFQILSRTHTRSRPHLMPTIETHSHIIATSRLALCVQRVSVRRPLSREGDDASESAIVYVDSDPVWLDWTDVAPFHELVRTLTHFRQVVATDDRCIRLSDGVAAKPVYALTDERCPTLSILLGLKTLGWRSVNARTQHDSVAIGVMDGREARFMKLYYITLLQLPTCLPLTTVIPSDQPISFYRCLSRGITTQPGLGRDVYTALLKGKPTALPAALEDGASEEQHPRRTLKSQNTESNVLDLEISLSFRLTCLVGFLACL